MNKERAKSWLEKNKFKYWRIVYATNGNTAARSLNEEGENLEDSIIFFEETSEILNPASYLLYGRQTDGQRSSEAVFSFNIETSSQETAQAPNLNYSAINGIQTTHFSEIIELRAQIARLEADKRLLEQEANFKEKEYKKSLKEAENKGNSTEKLEKIIEIASPFLAKILAPQPQAVKANIAGTQAPAQSQTAKESEENSPENIELSELVNILINKTSKQQILDAFRVLASYDPEYLKALINQII